MKYAAAVGDGNKAWVELMDERDPLDVLCDGESEYDDPLTALLREDDWSLDDLETADAVVEDEGVDLSFLL